MNKKKLILSLVCILLWPVLSKAQNAKNNVVNNTNINKESIVDWDMSLTFKTKNIFRGLLPSPAPTYSMEGAVTWNNWMIGVYGGAGVDGYYHETDFILAYKKPRYSIHLEYYYNYTQGISDIPTPSGIFDFNRQTTRGLLDFMVMVDLDKEGKWKLLSSTFLFGRDTDIETITIGDETTTRRTDQRYSHYIELKRTWNWDNNKVQAHIGGSFSWNNPGGAHLYGSKPGIHNVGISYGKKVKINDHITLPVKLSTYVNPLAETAHVVFSVNLLEFGK